MEYIVHNGHTHFAVLHHFQRKYSANRSSHASVSNRKGGENMICETEARDLRDYARFFERTSVFDNVDTLIEVSIAALTTEPELRDVGRSLISLARYYVCKTLKSHCD